jgi:hypothetical protein
MSEERIETDEIIIHTQRAELSAYISESGNVCLKSADCDGDDVLICIPPESVGKTIDALEILRARLSK